MNIETKTGNLLHVKEGHIVHGCNAQGVMGSGVAVGIKDNFPGAYSDYRRIYESDTKGGLVLGEAYPFDVNEKLTIWNAITQNLYGGNVRQVSYDAIETCFRLINDYMKSPEYNTHNSATPKIVHIPMIGAARGGGNWNIIKTIIEETMEFPVILWLPDSTVTTL